MSICLVTMMIKNRCLLIIAFVLFLFAPVLWTGIVNADVHVDYPNTWWVSYEDKDLPGSLSKSRDDYVQELVNWASRRGIEMSLDMADSLIDLPFDAGLDTQKIQFNNTDEDGNVSSGTYFDPTKPIWHTMRDIIFLETLQNSVEHWNECYIAQLGISSVSPGDAYNRAFKIQKKYNKYLDEGFHTNEDHNPLVAILIGIGTTSYGEFIDSDGLLHSIANGLASKALEAAASSIVDNGNYLVTLSDSVNSFFLMDLAGDAICDYIGKKGFKRWAYMWNYERYRDWSCCWRMVALSSATQAYLQSNVVSREFFF